MSCEEEITVLGEEKYRQLYFEETPFNDQAVDPDTYLIVGRRGSGKSALAQYFSFQDEIRNPLCIEVRKPSVYQQLLAEVSKRTSESRAIAVDHLRRVWEFVIWKLIVSSLRGDAPETARGGITDTESHRVSHFVAEQIQHLMSFFDEEDLRMTGRRMEQIVDDHNLDQVKQEAVQAARRQPIIIAIETLEQYDIENKPLMYALGALIEYAASFNLRYSLQSIHLKVFVAGEVFQHMQEAVLLNPLKAIRDPVHLLWRPRDLLRFISWRLYRHLQETGMWRHDVGDIDWENSNDVLANVWIPHFGRSLTNAQGQVEDTWPYVLRHTQMRPRQLIRLCNTIASRSIQDGTFPRFSEKHIKDGVKIAEKDLAGEVLNAFSEIYPRCDRIVEALMRVPKMFDGRELDRRAKQSAALWPKDTYSPERFRLLVAELGIIGRVTRGTLDSEYVDADFEYGSSERLLLTHRDTCVVHPMFYSRLNVEMNTEARVIPFTTRRDDGQQIPAT
jgi:hypothetical protein